LYSWLSWWYLNFWDIKLLKSLLLFLLIFEICFPIFINFSLSLLTKWSLMSTKIYWGATYFFHRLPWECLIFFFFKTKRVLNTLVSTLESPIQYMILKLKNIGTWLHLRHVLCHWLTMSCPICFWNKRELNTPISALEPPIQYNILKLKNIGTWLHLLLLQGSKKAKYQNWN
jgi:hypothetical protein